MADKPKPIVWESIDEELVPPPPPGARALDAALVDTEGRFKLNLQRAKIHGGWLVAGARGAGVSAIGGLTFVPDAEHDWGKETGEKRTPAPAPRIGRGTRGKPGKRSKGGGG
jgi:hypothetical protein